MKRILTVTIAAAMAATSAVAGGSIPPDKQGHFMGGAFIGTVVTATTKSPAAGCLAAVVAGAGKEVLDGPMGGHQEMADFLFTAAGGCLSSVFTISIGGHEGAAALKYDAFTTDAAVRVYQEVKR